ncbi:hypothetical protein L7F22_008108 [Adiantum nelumboides]|nr:hypothetical protein [Adiantum nelumboides]
MDPSASVHSNCTNSCSINSKWANDHRSKSIAGVSSPRSALQQLLLPPISQSHPPNPSAADDEINLMHGPSLLESMPAASLSGPIFKGVRELVIPASRSKWMEAMISSEYPKSSGIESSWKQANMSVWEKSKKKSSLFVLASSSPTAEHTKQCHLYGTDKDTSCSMDMEFLNSCYLCKQLLGQGHDVFMYSGDKGFCSMECRYQQIVIDERKERHAPLVIRSGASPIYQGYMATAGAAARTTIATSVITSHRINRPIFMNFAAAA